MNQTNKTSALDKLLGQLGFYATCLSSIAYLQNSPAVFGRILGGPGTRF